MYCLITLVSFCMVSCGESFGIVFNTFITDSNGFALNLASSWIMIANAMAGEHFPCFLSSGSGSDMSDLGILSVDMPGFFKGVNYISPSKYAAASMSIKSFKNFKFTCTDAQRLPDGSCPIQTGRQVLDVFNYHTSLASNVGASVAVTVGFRLAAYVVLRLSQADFGVTKRSYRGEAMRRN